MVETESILNSRPLTNVAEQPDATFKMIQINRQNCNKNFDSFVQQR